MTLLFNSQLSMKVLQIVVGVCCCLFSLPSYAHSPNEAFFKIYQQNNQLLMYAEFPWTIRKVLVERYPELATATTQAALENGLLKYLNTCIKAIDVDNQPLELEHLEPYTQADVHSHSVAYMIRFDRNKKLKQLSNQTMFERYKKQVNYHTIIWGDNTWEGETSVSRPTLLLEQLDPTPSKWWWCVPIVVLLLGIVVGIKKLRQPHQAA